MSRLFLPALLAMALLSCKADPEPPGECIDDGDCEGTAICTPTNDCVPVQCVHSSQCPFGTFCEYNTCFEGCGVDSDCQAGFTCNAETWECEIQPCDDTAIDCSLGELCDVETGACEVPENMCSSCSGATYSDCIELGGTCYWGDQRCYLPCTEDDEPPRGFICYEGLWNGDCGEVNVEE